MGVFTAPGATQLILIFFGVISSAKPRVNASNSAFRAGIGNDIFRRLVRVYGAQIHDRAALWHVGTEYLQKRKTDLRLTFSTLSKSSSGKSTTGWNVIMAASFT
jgi:succinate dehydrogenase hydrophobic anchor subunit